MPTRSPRRDTAAVRRKWLRARRAETQFARALRLVANKCGTLARKSFNPNSPLGSAAKLKRELDNYGQTLLPWALATANRMVADVARRDEQFWYEQSRLLSRNLKAELAKTSIAPFMRQRTQEAATLISSLPLEAAQRVEKLSVEYMTRGIRASQLSDQIMRTGQVTKSRANLIARTETSRTAGLLQEVRAKAVGAEGYIWRTSEDADVRERHRRLAGRFFSWDNPPVAGENGERAHPGGIYNCRCWAEVVLPGEPKRNRSRFLAEAA